MSDRQRVENRLRRKEQEIVRLEEKIKEARAYAQALRDVLRIMGTGAGSSGDDSANAVVLRAGSAVEKARAEILRQRAPVHISDLLEALGKDSTRENRASLTGSLSAYVRRGEIFTRPQPSTFGLLELGQTEKAEEAPTPPRGFGQYGTDTVESASSESIPPFAGQEDDEITF